MRPPTAWSLPAGADDDPSQDELRLAVATPPVPADLCSPRTCADQRRPGNQFTLAGYCVRTVPEVTKFFHLLPHIPLVQKDVVMNHVRRTH